ncbi:MAG: sigma-70 family RNA polymerase sigma factor [Methylococcales bacterium]|nr:sigma-70 family RNA polymerase sigma factor [Methylococcales bacterium]
MTEINQRIVVYIPRLRRYSQALVKGHSVLAEDLVQDTLERALARSHQFREGTDLRAWLFTIMHNIYANQVRRISNGPSFVELPETIDEMTTDTSTSKLELRDLQQAISELPLEQRKILLLVTLEGLPYQQVADMLGIPVGTVMSKLSRTRQHLRKLTHRDDAPHLRRIK